MELSTTVHRQLGPVLAIADEWRSLHESSGDPNPFTGPDWAVTWLERFTAAGGAEPFVVEVRDGSRLVGVAALHRARVLGGAAAVVRPVGTGTPWIGPYELPAVVAAAGLGRDVARAVVERLCAESASWDWAQLVLGPAAPWLEPEWLPDWSFTVLQKRTRANTVLDLSGGRDVYAGRRNLKESFRRARNRLTREFGESGWSVRRVTDPAEVPVALDRLVGLHGVRASLRDGRPVHAHVFADPRVLDYVRDVVERMADRKGASVYELLVGDEVIAAQLVLHTQTASYSSVSGITERAWPYSAVTYLQSVAVQDAQDAGSCHFNLSTGPNRAKLRWTEDVRVTPEFVLVGPRRRSQLLHLAVDVLGAVAAFREARNAHRV